jgi:hypothetical protein
VVNIAVGIVGIALGVASALRGGPWYLIWVFLVLAILLIGTAIYRPIRNQFQRWCERRKDKQIARENWPRFRGLVRDFEDFVSTRTNRTLYYIISNDLSESARTELSKLLINISMCSGFWDFFVARVNRERTVLSELAYAIQEFHYLLAQYNNSCVVPIFEQVPTNVKPILTEQDKRKLNTFRERYGKFLGDYMAFAKQLSKARPQLSGLPYDLTYPTQL